MRLKDLIHLRRGDFLCEVLEYLDIHISNSNNVKLKLQEFWPSEDYFFHTDHQLSLVKKYCPHIKTAYFMYKRDCSGSLNVLENFICLTGNNLNHISNCILRHLNKIESLPVIPLYCCHF